MPARHRFVCEHHLKWDCIACFLEHSPQHKSTRPGQQLEKSEHSLRCSQTELLSWCLPVRRLRGKSGLQQAKRRSASLQLTELRTRYLRFASNTTPETFHTVLCRLVDLGSTWRLPLVPEGTGTFKRGVICAGRSINVKNNPQQKSSYRPHAVVCVSTDDPHCRLVSVSAPS